MKGAGRSWADWPYTLCVDYDPGDKGNPIDVIERSYRGLRVNPIGHAMTGRMGVKWRVEVKARTLPDARTLARRLRRLKATRMVLFVGDGPTVERIPLRVSP